MALTITTIDAVSASVTGQGLQSLITGAATSGSAVVIPITGTGALSLQITGAWSGTLAIEKSVDGGTTYTPTDAMLNGTDQLVQQVTNNCVLQASVGGASHGRIRAVAAISGTATISPLGTVVNDLQHVVVANGEGSVQIVQVQPAISSASAYLAQQIVGGIQTITGAARKPYGGALLRDISIFDAGAASTGFSVAFFKQSPSNGTYADKGTLTINPLDIPYYLGSVQVPTTAITRFGAGSNVYSVNGVGLALRGDSSGNVYAIATVLNTPSWTNTNQLTFNYGVSQS